MALTTRKTAVADDMSAHGLLRLQNYGNRGDDRLLDTENGRWLVARHEDGLRYDGHFSVVRLGVFSGRRTLVSSYVLRESLCFLVGAFCCDLLDERVVVAKSSVAPFVRRVSIRSGEELLWSAVLVATRDELREWPDLGDLFDFAVRVTASRGERRRTFFTMRALSRGERIDATEFREQLQEFVRA